MRIKVLFFGILEDIVGCKENEYANFNTSDELLETLKENYKELNNKTFQIAVNQEIININTKLKDGDIIALLPPFAGG